MIYIIHKKLVLLKNHLNYLKDSSLKCFFKEYNRFFFPIIFYSTYDNGKLSLEQENIIKDIRNLFRLRKN